MLKNMDINLKYCEVINLNLKLYFKGYIEALYLFRIKFPKSNPLNLIAKLLLNSLYGRFGMDDNFIDITIFDNFKEFKL
jgi:hypothetical protein